MKDAKKQAKAAIRHTNRNGANIRSAQGEQDSDQEDHVEQMVWHGNDRYRSLVGGIAQAQQGHGQGLFRGEIPRHDADPVDQHG